MLPLKFNEEHYELYIQYQNNRHRSQNETEDDITDYNDFLIRSNVESKLVEFRINNNLVIGTLKQNTNNKIVYKHSLPISGIASSEDIRLYLENILSEFNHLLSVLLKSDKIVQQSHNLINQKIVGHA